MRVKVFFTMHQTQVIQKILLEIREKADEHLVL